MPEVKEEGWKLVVPILVNVPKNMFPTIDFEHMSSLFEDIDFNSASRYKDLYIYGAFWTMSKTYKNLFGEDGKDHKRPCFDLVITSNGYKLTTEESFVSSLDDKDKLNLFNSETDKLI